MILLKRIGLGCLALGIALLLVLGVGLAGCPTPQPDGTGAVSYTPYEDRGMVCDLLSHTWISTIWTAVICVALFAGIVLIIFWW
jgi:hypothetical protein